MFLDLKLLTERSNDFLFGLCQKSRKLWCMYLAGKKKKYAVKEANSFQKAKRKVRMMFFEVKLQPDNCR